MLLKHNYKNYISFRIMSESNFIQYIYKQTFIYKKLDSDMILILHSIMQVSDAGSPYVYFYLIRSNADVFFYKITPAFPSVVEKHPSTWHVHLRGSNSHKSTWTPADPHLEKQPYPLHSFTKHSSILPAAISDYQPMLSRYSN